MRATFVLPLFLAGCAWTNTNADRSPRYAWRATPVTGPDATQNWSIVTCIDSKANCYEGAAATCKDGYDVADTTDHSTVSTSTRGFANGGSSWAASSFRSDATERFKQEWLVHCKSAPTAKAPPSPDDGL